MVYLVIMFAVAAVGIGSLIVQQRRERAHLETVEGFRNSLSKIAPENQPAAWRRSRARRRPPVRTARRHVATRNLDPHRRAAARRRVEARRRARSRVRV